MSNFWKSLETVKNAVQEGVKEFQQEVQQGVQALEKRGGDISALDELQQPTSSQLDPQIVQLNQKNENESQIGSQEEVDQQLDDIINKENNSENEYQLVEEESNATSSFQPIMEHDKVNSLDSQLDLNELDDQKQGQLSNSNEELEEVVKKQKLTKVDKHKFDDLVEMVSILREEKTVLSESLRYKDSKLTKLEEERLQLRTQVQNLTKMVQQQMEKLAGKVASQEEENELMKKERQSLVDTIAMLRMDLASCSDQRDVYKTETEALRTQVQNLQQKIQKSKEEIDHQKKENTAANVLLVEREMELDQARTEAVSKAELQEYRHRALSAEEQIQDLKGKADTVEKQLVEVEKNMQQLEEAKRQAEKVRSEAEARADAALSLVEEERAQRAEAQDVSATLKQDSDRRARIFNNAVQTAVAKIQSDFQTERQELLSQITELRSALRENETKLQEASQQVQHAQDHERQLQQQIASVEEEKLELSNQLSASKFMGEELRLKIHALEEERMEMESELNETQPQIVELQERCKLAQQEINRKETDLANLKTKADEEVLRLRQELEQQRVRGQAAVDAFLALETQQQTQIDQVQSESSQLEFEKAKQRIQQLEQQVFTLKQSQRETLFTPQKSGADQILQNLGIEKASKLFKGGQLQGGAFVGDIESSGRRLNLMRPKDKQKAQQVQGEVAKGQVPLRTWLLIGYLGILHLTVMFQYTQKSVDLERACAQYNQ